LLHQGNSAKALMLVEEGERQQGHDHGESAWKLRLLKSEALLTTGQADRAIAELAKNGEPETAGLRAIKKIRLGHAHMVKGEYSWAEVLLSAAFAEAHAAGAVEVEAEAAAFRGACLIRLNRIQEGEAQLHSAIAQARQARNGYLESGALINIAFLRQRQFRYDEAAQGFRRLVPLTEHHARAQYPFVLLNLSTCLARLGQFDEALNYLGKAVAEADASQARVSLQAALGETGNIHLLRGDPDKALPFLRRAQEVAESLKRHVDAAIWAGNLAIAHTMLAQWSEAERSNEVAARIKTSYKTGNLVYNTLNAARIALGREEYRRAGDLFRAALAASPEDPSIRWDAHAGLGTVAFALDDRNGAFTHFDSALAVIEKTRANLLATESKITLLSRLIRFYRDYVESLAREGQVERALAVADSSRTQLLPGGASFGTRRATAAQYRDAARRRGEVFLSYWLAPARSYVWVVTGSEVACVPLAANDSEIAKLANAYRASIEEGAADPMRFRNPAGRSLYDVLVRPVRKWIPPGARVVVVPDGALHNLNFETLPIYEEKGSGRYLIEELAISVAPSLPVAAPPRPERLRSILLIGDPPQADPEFPRLRHAGSEIDGIAARFTGTAIVHRGASATPAAFRAARAGEFSAIHFAAHAVANRESPLDSALILAPDDSGYKLYARDLEDAALRAELVTISSCKSAGARVYSGEGLVGFAWALLRSGARNVIAGLWDVNDRSTGEMMAAFYAKLAEGAVPQIALRDVKLRLVQSSGNFRKPYYWGPFQHYTASR
jgi:CHAT domain-containing protein/tetratricopeptide (TPR) repeat protein